MAHPNHGARVNCVWYQIRKFVKSSQSIIVIRKAANASTLFLEAIFHQSQSRLTDPRVEKYDEIPTLTGLSGTADGLLLTHLRVGIFGSALTSGLLCTSFPCCRNKPRRRRFCRLSFVINRFSTSLYGLTGIFANEIYELVCLEHCDVHNRKTYNVCSWSRLIFSLRYAMRSEVLTA